MFVLNMFRIQHVEKIFSIVFNEMMN
ncbi:hypothetical protein BLA29_014144 [Euroglyphus maynei]|uniref:Uncharacterized protein n=1 Tax=Euroglyphus maynei TaxID=6958 RepID=A0A1Y3BM61_EURMA|nr:hypothetical protein BLA29_014144 [Euroglyphus maynei]